jgi:lysozyme
MPMMSASPQSFQCFRIVIGGKSVAFRSGITQEQPNELLAQDHKPSRKAVKSLVTVPLSRNQLDALIDFVYNMGLGTLEDSVLLKQLNAGKYGEVPRELLKYDRVGGTVVRGQLARRRSEFALWKK